MSQRNVAVMPLYAAVSVAQAATAYTSSSKFRLATGYAGIRLISTAGSITVSQQCSVDDIIWYDPVDAAGNTLGTVCTSQGVTTGRYISYSPVLTSYIRFKIVEGNTAATTVTIDLIFQEEA